MRDALTGCRVTWGARGVLRGFTLIELLVVISIIALLIAILLPALAASKESARRTLCASQQRQLTLGALVYAEDHGQWLPTGHWWIPTTIASGKGLLPYLNGEVISTYPYMTLAVAKIMACPSKPEGPINDKPVYMPSHWGSSLGERIHTDYSYGGGFGGYEDQPAGINWVGWHHYGFEPYRTAYNDPAQPGPVPRLTLRRNLSGSAIFADRMWYNDGVNANTRYIDYIGFSPSNHNGADGFSVGGNATYADGHGSWRSPDQIQDRVRGWYAPCFLY